MYQHMNHQEDSSQSYRVIPSLRDEKPQILTKEERKVRNYCYLIPVKFRDSGGDYGDSIYNGVKSQWIAIKQCINIRKKLKSLKNWIPRLRRTQITESKLKCNFSFRF